MNLDTITDRWEYIIGGFTYIDMNREAGAADTAGMARGELLYYIQSLTADDALIKALGLDAKPVPFDTLPRSFEIMLKCDNDYLTSAPETPLDAQFGSVAMALLYGDVEQACGANSGIQDAMLGRIAQVTGKQPVLE